MKTVLAGQPEPPTYFAKMKRINKEGPAILGQFQIPAKLDAAKLPELLARKALVIDTRPASEFAAGHMPGTINIPFTSSFVTWAGWLVQADEFYLIVDAATAAARLDELARELALIGIDRITGFFDAAAVTGRATRAADHAARAVAKARQRDRAGRAQRRRMERRSPAGRDAHSARLSRGARR